VSVRVELAGAVATVTVDNPPVNALDDPTLEALGEAARSLAARGDVRAVVLTGAGEGTFVAGADLKAFSQALGDVEQMGHHVHLTARVFDAWARLPMPAVAAIGGHAMGGGLELALVCDFLVCDPAALLGTPETTIGLICGAGGTQRLPRRVGRATATRMVLLRPLDAEAALAAGLVEVVAAPGAALDEAHALAVRLARLPARAVQAAKAALRVADRSLDDGLAEERRLFLEVSATADAREGAQAFIAKRRPEYTHA
jgi:enoyl-CoA hydratase/carnithine racemase